MIEVLRRHAEQQYAEELAELAAADDRQRPPSWRLSPWAVTQYVLGSRLDSGFEVSPKYIGDRRLIEIAVATLATDRALLLLGLPGTAKSWVSEHLAAAISGDSTLLVQGTAGTAEEAIRYGWNYALLLSRGPSMDALVPSPVLRGMREGKVVRIEELTRIQSDVQDGLITLLSEKTLPVPELDAEVQAVKGFNVIATANNRDRGVNDLSGALKRRLGGGTDIGRALDYCQSLVTRPADTVLVLVSDLYEGGVKEKLLRRAASLVASGVRLVALLALGDSGHPAYDHEVAAALHGLGVPAFACTPDLVPELMAAALDGRDLTQWAAARELI
jgi:AAA domain (dynein-related subfamily)/VWA domain containing CoxE-like protein